MSMFQRLLTPSDKLKKENNAPEPCEEVEDGQPHNPFTEILILHQHSDIVRLLLRINDRRFVSAGDDNKAIIWEVQYGRQIATLIGHTHPITSLLLLPSVEGGDDVFIVSGSSDRQIRVWNAETGECVHTLTEHCGSVRCLIHLTDGLFCAGGENLSLWNRQGQLLHMLNKCTLEDVHLMIAIKNNRLVIAADKELVVYRLNLDGTVPELVVLKHLNSHQETIHSLIPISTSCFGTGSVDGMIIIWTSSTLQQTKTLRTVTERDIENKTFLHSVQALICVQERYLFAAIGCGFYAYDVTAVKETLVIQKRSAHLSKITCMGFACEGEILATCSEDKCIRLWGRKPVTDPWGGDVAVTTMERFTGLQSNELLNSTSPWEPSLLGECCAHGEIVQGFLDFDHEGIVTCGSDGLVIVWKNSEVQKVRRNQSLRKFLINRDGIV
ncbi:WD repeat-containing protein 41-like [Physella acuta]|uniref:WD repeat-containing protein 41-like n=1 Tax=Physella acuta TaxID=109671 RepID=UPI0027DE6207|nr:WD repeat-containing protein 41-like [Physella acuta]